MTETVIDVKIVGKISKIILDASDYQTTVFNNYSHFRSRLKERYGMEITKEEYLELSSCGYYKTTFIGIGIKYIIINFKGVEVFAIKQKKKYKLLLTALPITNYYKQTK